MNYQDQFLLSLYWHCYQFFRIKTWYLQQLLCAEPDTTETQADDTIVGDAASSVAIDTQPQDASVEANESNTATFTVATTVTGAGSATYQWQVNQVDISGATSASYETAAVVAGDNTNKYRCRVGTSQGATEVISDAATLTVT